MWRKIEERDSWRKLGKLNINLKTWMGTTSADECMKTDETTQEWMMILRIRTPSLLWLLPWVLGWVSWSLQVRAWDLEPSSHLPHWAFDRGMRYLGCPFPLDLAIGQPSFLLAAVSWVQREACRRRWSRLETDGKSGICKWEISSTHLGSDSDGRSRSSTAWTLFWQHTSRSSESRRGPW